MLKKMIKFGLFRKKTFLKLINVIIFISNFLVFIHFNDQITFKYFGSTRVASYQKLTVTRKFKNIFPLKQKSN